MAFRILIIEDEPNWREQFQDILEAMSFKVDATEGTKEAEALLRKGEYALILLDAALDQAYPPLTVQQFIISSHEQYPDLPIVAVSGKSLDASQGFRLSKLGVVDFIHKGGLQLEDFRRRIQDALQKRQYNLAAVRGLLLAAFTTEELHRFCFDTPLFRPVHDQFALGMGKADLVDRILEFSETQLLMRELLQAVKDHNPRQYTRFEADLYS